MYKYNIYTGDTVRSCTKMSKFFFEMLDFLFSELRNFSDILVRDHSVIATTGTLTCTH